MRKLFTNKNKKGFAMAELLAVSIVLLFIFSVLFSNYLPLVAEYENRLSYNDVTAQYAAHYIRKMYKEALEDTTIGEKLKSIISDGINVNGYFTVYKEDKNIDEIKNHVLDKDENNYKKIINEYGIEEIIITKYKLNDDDEGTGVKTAYTEDKGSLYNYINYLPNYEKSIYTGKDEGDQLYRIILKTKDFGYATTPILSDYNTPGSCFKGRKIPNSNNLVITHYNYSEENGCGKTVTINNRSIEIENDQGTGTIIGAITAIGEGVFERKEDGSNLAYQVEEVILSDSVETIGKNSFKGSNLNKLPDLRSVTSIGDYAFANTKIQEADLTNYPSSSTIGDYAFANNIYLKNITLPNSNIYSDKTDSDGKKMLTIGLFKESGTSADGIAVTIPGGMTDVGDEMFYLANINGITLNERVQTIGTKAFSQKKSDNNPTDYKVETVDIPASVKEIGIESFEMLGINTLKFNEGDVDLKILGSAFKGNNISLVTIPSRVVEIGNSAFEASNIETLDFGENVKITVIPLSAFSYNKISSLVIPEGVTSIGSKAFLGNTSLSSLTLSSKLETIKSSAFSSTGLTSITIPGSVTKIEGFAFKGSKLENVEIAEEGENLSIQNGVFQENSSLKEFTIPSRVSSIGDNIFSGIGEDAKIYNYATTLNDIKWCDKFAANNTCVSDGPDDENKLTITYTIKNEQYNTRYVYNMGGVTNE